MNIAVIGAGYVGLVTAACFSEMGNKVVCTDIDESKISLLNKGEVPIYEPGLKDLVANNLGKSLFFTTDIAQAVQKSDVIFIAVGTPMKQDGNADLTAVHNVANTIGETMNGYKLIVSKSTVPVGTTFEVGEIIQARLEERGENYDFDMISNPEFLKEGAAVNDFMKPDRVVIGAEKDTAISVMKQLYSPFFRVNDRFITMDVLSAEMTKYAANAMLATKISFINEMANICERVGADINKVRVGIGSDKRIGYNFIYPGIGYGGTCFPKDVSALIQLSKKHDYEPRLIASVDEVNQQQKSNFLEKILQRFGTSLRGVSFGVWGLSFKPETSDMRAAPSLYIIEELLKRGAEVKAYDPKAIPEAKANYFKGEAGISYGKFKYEVLTDADAMILLTEWKEFRSPDFSEMKLRMKRPVIFDGRNQYNAFQLETKGFEYYQVGKNKKDITVEE